MEKALQDFAIHNNSLLRQEFVTVHNPLLDLSVAILLHDAMKVFDLFQLPLRDDLQ